MNTEINDRIKELEENIAQKDEIIIQKDEIIVAKEEYIKQTEKNIQEMKEKFEKLISTAAELQNSLKRQEKDHKLENKKIKENILLQILPSFQTVLTALSYLPEDQKDAANIIVADFVKTLNKMSIFVISPTVGDEFDVELHMVLSTQDCNEDYKAGQIAQVFSSGLYLLEEEKKYVVTPANVSVFK